MTEALAEPPERRPLADVVARRSVAEDLDSTLFVEAGAGTGKTTALVGRIVALLATGRAELSEIAAITFTEAAAGELKARLHRALSEAGDERLVAMAGAVEDATITTIHGFAQRILAEHPIEAGLPLRFEVLDETAATIEFDRRFAEFLEELYEDRSIRPVLLAGLALGIGVGPLRDLLWAFEDRSDLASAIEEDRRVLIEEIVERACSAVLRAGELAVEHCVSCRNENDRLLDRLGALAGELAGFDPTADWLDRLRWLAGLERRGGGGLGRRDAWPDVELVRRAFLDYETARASALGELGTAVASSIGGRLATESRRQAELRRAHGTLRFHDLLLLARDLVRDHPDVRRQLRARLHYLLVDEFQDTDPLQLELVLLLGSDDGELDPGRLFFVGDPRQSIYSFRGARLDLYTATRASICEDRPTRLVANFRSMPSILRFVNACFGELFASRSSNGDAFHLGDLVASRSEPLQRPAQPRVQILGGPQRDARIEELRILDAKAVASVIARALEEGWEVGDPGASRPIRSCDIAVLLPTRNGLGALETALEEQGIDFRVAHTTLIYGSSEVRELLALLRAVDEPGDERAVLAALRVSALGCSDADLLAWRSEGGAWRFDDAAAVGENAAVTTAMAQLRHLSGIRHRLSVDQVLEAIVERCSIRQLLTVRRNRAEALRRVEFVIERARAYASAGGTSIGGFLAFADQEKETGSRGLELVTVGEADDAVRIMTMHGAKGLEFPLVVLAQLGARPRTGARGATVLTGAEGLFELRLNQVASTSGFADARADEVELSRDESLRLLYVAATRARDHLVIALNHTPSSTGEPSLAEQVYGFALDHERLWRRGDGPRLQRFAFFEEQDPAITEVSSNARFGTAADLEQWSRSRRELLASVNHRSSVASSSLEHLVGGAAPQRVVRMRRDDEQLVDDGPWLRARQASALGRAVHRVLQRVDLDRGLRLEALARAAALAEGIEDRVSEVARLAESARMSPVVQRAVASGNVHREMPFRVAIGEGTLDGVVDLCFFDGDELVVVDYKTDALSSLDEVPVAAARYRLQAGAYALGLEAASSHKVARVELVFLAPPDGAVCFSVPDLDQATNAAREATLSSLAPDADDPAAWRETMWQ